MTSAGQGALFDVPAVPRRKTALERIVVREWPGGIRPWDPIDQADTDLGWEHRYVDHRRATAIRLELEADRGHR